MDSLDRRKGPSLHRFDSLPLNHDSVRARSDYLDAYQQEVTPLVNQRTIVSVDLEIAANRLQATMSAQAKDGAIRRLQAELTALGGDGPSGHAIPTNDTSGPSEAQATYDALHAQIINLDKRIEEEDAKLLARFGLS